MADGATFATLRSLNHYTELSAEASAERVRGFLETMRSRHTIRDFVPDPVPRALVEDCIAAAALAPSGANHQPWHFVLVGDPRVKARIRAAAETEERAFYAGRAGDEWLKALAPLGTNPEKPFLETAPWLIAVFAQRRGGPEIGDSRKNYYVNESVGIACGFLIAALHLAGLATLTHTPNPMTFLSAELKRPPTEKPYLLVVAGKPAPDALIPEAALRKKPLRDILTVY